MGLNTKLRRITTNHLYFPEIDGIRFIAIILVVFFHIYYIFNLKSPIKFTDNKESYQIVNTFFLNGNRGVELFFVLSGFILSLPFAQYHLANGNKVNLKKYYLRRLTRLEPPYFLSMSLILLIMIVTKHKPVNVLIPSWLASLGYMHNFLYHGIPILNGAAWSLEVEIQFYLIAPLFFSLFALNKLLRRFLFIVLIFIIVLIQSLYPPDFFSLLGFAQYFFVGILLTDIYVTNNIPAIFVKNSALLIAIISFTLIIYLPLENRLQIPFTVPQFFIRLIFPFLIGLLFISILKNKILKNIFSYKFIPIIGGMCYSIYLIHGIIISLIRDLPLKLHITQYYLPNLFLQLLLFSIPVLLLSGLYYLYIERPFMSSRWVEMLMKKNTNKI